jgi:hypothetical protein
VVAVGSAASLEGAGFLSQFIMTLDVFFGATLAAGAEGVCGVVGADRSAVGGANDTTRGASAWSACASAGSSARCIFIGTSSGSTKSRFGCSSRCADGTEGVEIGMAGAVFTSSASASIFEDTATGGMVGLGDTMKLFGVGGVTAD